MAFATLEPFGGPVEDYRAGLAASATVNVNRKPDTDAVDAFVWYPWHMPPPPPEQTPEEISERLRAMLNAKARAAQAREASDGK